MKTVCLLSISNILHLNGLSQALDVGSRTLRPALVPSTAHSTTIYAYASPLHTASPPLTTQATHKLRFDAKRNDVPITTPGAIIVSDGTTLSAFPLSVCGFIDGDPNTAFICGNTYYGIYETCAVVSSTLCCATGGMCAVDGYSQCQNVRVTDPSDANWGWTSFVISSKLYCDLQQSYQCATRVLGSVASRTYCEFTIYNSMESIWPAQQFLNYFAGYTLQWDDTWNIKAIRGPTQTSTSSSSTSTTLSASASPTDAVGYLERFKAGPPTCVSNMTDLCPILYSSVRDCINSTAGSICYCVAFTSNACPGLCLANHQPNDYLNYVVSICDNAYTNQSLPSTNSSDQGNFTAKWQDYTNLSHAAYVRLFPWIWNVDFNSTEILNTTVNSTRTSPDNDPAHCSSVLSSLMAFAIVNLIVFVASIITANRKVVYIVTFGFFGGEEGGKWWPASAILSVMINLAGNVINALLIVRTPGYHHVPLVPLILLWCTRPRLAWLVILLVWLTIRMGMDPTTYLNSAVAALMAEVILQAFAAVYMGMSINYARMNKFYLIDHLKYTPHGNDALVFYIGALIWTVSIGIAFLRAVYTFTPVGGIVKGALLAVWDHIKRLVLMIWNLIFNIARFVWVVLRGMILFLWQRLRRLTHYCKQQHRRRKWEKSEDRPSTWAAQPYRGEYTAVKLLFRIGEEDAEEEAQAGNEEDHRLTTTARRPRSRPRVNSSESAESAGSRRPKRSRSTLNTCNDNIGQNGRLMDEPASKKERTLEVYIEEMGLKPKLLDELKWLVLALLLPWIGQWIFWIGFVRMAQDLYCPPSIWTLTTVWSACSVVALWCGASV